MSMVYVVIRNPQSNRQIVGVFSTKEQAAAQASCLNEEPLQTIEITEYELDAPYWLVQPTAGKRWINWRLLEASKAF